MHAVILAKLNLPVVDQPAAVFDRDDRAVTVQAAVEPQNAALADHKVSSIAVDGEVNAVEGDLTVEFPRELQLEVGIERSLHLFRLRQHAAELLLVRGTEVNVDVATFAERDFRSLRFGWNMQPDVVACRKRTGKLKVIVDVQVATVRDDHAGAFLHDEGMQLKTRAGFNPHGFTRREGQVRTPAFEPESLPTRNRKAVRKLKITHTGQIEEIVAVDIYYVNVMLRTL